MHNNETNPTYETEIDRVKKFLKKLVIIKPK